MNQLKNEVTFYATQNELRSASCNLELFTPSFLLINLYNHAWISKTCTVHAYKCMLHASYSDWEKKKTSSFQSTLVKSLIAETTEKINL